MILEYLDGQTSLFDDDREKWVDRITYDDTKPFLLNIHYARRMPCITDAFGLFIKGNKLIGVVTYGVPASDNLCVSVAGKENKERVRELNRLVILPQYNGKNYASYLVSHSLKMLPNNTFVVSYADTAWSHIGYVYQATNFLYCGATRERTDFYNPNGLHPRHNTVDTANGLRQSRSSKHRYVYLVGDKRTRKHMVKELKWKATKDYPKGDEVKYDVDNPLPIIPTEVTYEEQVRNDS